MTNGFEDGFKILENISVLEADYGDIESLQKLSSLFIRFRAGIRHMSAAIQLDREPAFRAEKVDNKRTYAVLAAKFLAG